VPLPVGYAARYRAAVTQSAVTSRVFEEVATRLPDGYRVREFDDSDREPIVEETNAERHPMERETADEWRRWESLYEDPTRLRVIVTDRAGAVAASGNIQAGFFPRSDGAQSISVGVSRAHRGRGIGGVLLGALEAEARRRNVPRIVAGTSAALPFALAWATKRGYREIGRRIMSYRELGSYDPAAWRDAIDRVTRDGIRIRTFAEVLDERDGEGQDRFWHEVQLAERPMWEDIPFASPTPHWPFERFYQMTAKNPHFLPVLSLLAYDGDTIAGLTTTGDREGKDGWTYMTGVAREYRGRGIAMALKVEVLARAKAAGRRAMCTVNDEPNRAMRSVNIKLGYQPVPDHVELEKRFAGA
jgi:GNAT superfamily N-acetyltransferase